MTSTVNTLETSRRYLTGQVLLLHGRKYLICALVVVGIVQIQFYPQRLLLEYGRSFGSFQNHVREPTEFESDEKIATLGGVTRWVLRAGTDDELEMIYNSMKYGHAYSEG